MEGVSSNVVSAGYWDAAGVRRRGESSKDHGSGRGVEVHAIGGMLEVFRNAVLLGSCRRDLGEKGRRFPEGRTGANAQGFGGGGTVGSRSKQNAFLEMPGPTMNREARMPMVGHRAASNAEAAPTVVHL